MTNGGVNTLLLLLTVAVPLIDAQQASVELHATSGGRHTGVLQSIQADRIVVRGAETPEYPLADTLQITTSPTDAVPAWNRFKSVGAAWLADESRLRPISWRIDNGHLNVAIEHSADRLALRLDDLLVFVKPTTRAFESSLVEAAETLAELATATAADVLAVVDPAAPSTTPTTVEGEIESLAEEGVTFRFGQQTGVVRWERVAGFAVRPLEQPRRSGRQLIDDPQLPAVRVATTGGNLLSCDTVRASATAITLSRGAGEIRLPVSHVRQLDWRARRMAFVHEWRLIEYGRPDRRSPQRAPSAVPGSGSVLQLNGEPTLAIDRSLAGERIALSSASEGPNSPTNLRSFEHGIALKGPVYAKFALPRDAARLRAKVAIAPAFAGDALVRVLGDDDELVSMRLRASDPPREIDMPVSGAKTLTLAVEAGENLDIGDVVHFASLRVLR